MIDESKDHDAEIPGKAKTADGTTQSVMLAKVGALHPMPHADGCVGCRRSGACSRCDGMRARHDGCSSGLCAGCCEQFHVHAGGDVRKIARAR